MLQPQLKRAAMAALGAATLYSAIVGGRD